MELTFDPRSGAKFDEPVDEATYRKKAGIHAWLYNPLTGEIRPKAAIDADPNGNLWNSSQWDATEYPAPSTTFDAPGYEPLVNVLVRAYNQAARGKGHERHANGEPFDTQVMQDMARRFGVGALLGQAFKKSEESQRMPVDRAINELLGAINYLAGAVIALERKQERI